MGSPVRKLELEDRLNVYFATLRTSSLFGDALKRSMENWQIYAAVTGSALAMTTNASASIIYSGVLDVTAAVASAQMGTPGHSNEKFITLKNAAGASIHVGFNIIADQFNSPLGSNSRQGAVGIQASHMDFLLQTNLVKRLSSGAKISGGGHTSQSRNGFATGSHTLAARLVKSSNRKTYGWSKSKGFAGFSFSTVNKNQKDFGWVQLQFTVGSNTLINSLTVIDWGYQSSGAGIRAGDTGVVAPEPSTGALALLAAGAVGVAALRRRRKASEQSGAEATAK
jgi:PEP-CTERM motif